MPAPPNEFPDWLSPVLVKELRQGMRTRVFVGSFILLQIAMVFLALFGLSAASAGKTTEGYSAGFWGLVSVPLLIIMPSTALGSIAAERKANTLELVFLSRLTARRILFGKWVALLVQSAILVAAVFPFAVLRYFLGGVDLTSELQALASLLYLSALFTGIAVGVSPLPMRVTRTLFIILVVISMQGVPIFLFARVFSGMGGGPAMSGPLGFLPAFSGAAAILFGIPLALAILFLFWEYGAGLIAPPVENHSTPLRLLALACLGLAALVVALAPRYQDQALTAALAIGLVVCIGVINERPRLIPTLYRPFVRRRWVGHAVGWLLYPGWPSGVLFTTACFALVSTLWWSTLPPSFDTARVSWFLFGAVSALGTLLVPVAMIRRFVPQVPRPFLTFVLVQVGFVSLTAVSAIVHAFSPGLDPGLFFRIIPTYAVVTSGQIRPGATPLGQFGPAAAVTVFAVILLLLTMRKPWQEIRECERKALEA